MRKSLSYRMGSLLLGILMLGSVSLHSLFHRHCAESDFVISAASATAIAVADDAAVLETHDGFCQYCAGMYAIDCPVAAIALAIVFVLASALVTDSDFSYFACRHLPPVRAPPVS